MGVLQLKKVLVFDVWGEYAHFRRFYTTTSPLTFPIPPRTALCGLIGAIIGLDKKNNDYLRYFGLEEAYIGLRVMNPINKVRIAENLINTKEAGPGMNQIKRNGGRSPTRFEFLKNPQYRIYFHHTNDEIYKRLKTCLERHECIYTPCLGLSECVANFGYVGEFGVEAVSPNGERVGMNSVVPFDIISNSEGINFTDTGHFISMRLPTEMDTQRIVKKYSNILIEVDGNPLEVKLTCPHYVFVNPLGQKEAFIFIK